MTVEKMAYQYYMDVMPQYYDIILKVKYRRDSSDEASRILDIIHDGLSTDFTYFYNNSLARMYTSLCPLIGIEKSTDFVSLYKTNESQYEQLLADLIEILNEED